MTLLHGQVAAAMLGSWAMPVSSPDDKLDTVEAGAYTRPLFCSTCAVFVTETQQLLSQKVITLSWTVHECKPLS
jgi:hypothetical protein